MTKPRLIISNYDDLKNPYYAGGGASAVHEVAVRLTTSFTVTVLTSKYPGSGDQVVDGVLYKRLGLSFLGPRLGQLVFQLLLPLIAANSPFDVWMETFGPPFTSAFLPLFTKKPVVGLVHMLPALDMQRKYHVPLFPQLVEILALKLYSRFIVLSDASAREIHGLNPQSSIHIIPNGVNLPAHLPVLSPQHLLYMGRLEINQKGLDLLLYAYKLLQPHRPPPLVIAGSGTPSDETHLRRLITRLDLGDCVVLTGKVTGSIKDRLFRSALLVIVPSRFEAFSLTALESLSYSKPLVCFDIPGLKWLPTFCSKKAYQLTPLALSKAIADCLTSSDICRRLSRHSRSFARSYNWDRVASDYASVLTQAYSNDVVNWSTSPNPSV